MPVFKNLAPVFRAQNVRVDFGEVPRVVVSREGIGMSVLRRPH
jgi:hypothetical protein